MTEPPIIQLPRASRLARWWSTPRDASALWLGRHCVLVAWLGLLAAVLVPPHGLGFSLCWFQQTIGLPCPGCGLTRSLSCGIRGMFLESYHYHPLGLLILALFGFTAFQSLWPGAARDWLARHMQSRPFLFKSAYVAFVGVFVIFGVARALWAGR